MFEVKFVVADPALAKALRALGTIPLEPPVSVPVPESNEAEEQVPAVVYSPVKRRGKYRKAKRINGHAGRGVSRFGKEYQPGGAYGVIKEKLKGLDRIKSKQMIEMTRPLGYSSTAYSYALSKLRKEGVLKKLGKFGTYEVNL